MKKLKGSYFSYALLYGSYYFGMGIFASILSVYLSGTGKTAKEISLIVSANGIFSMALQPIIGMIYDRMQRDKQISFILLALSAAFGVSFAFLKNTILLFLFNGFAMSLLNSVNPVCERRALATRYSYGTIRIWAAIGYALASQTAGWTYEHIASTANFWLFGTAAVLMMIAFMLTEDVPAAVKSVSQKSSGIFISLLKNRQFLLFALISFLFSGSAGVNNTYVPLLLKNLLGSVTAVGTILFIGTMMELPVSLTSGKFMDRLSGNTLLRIDFALLIVQFAVYAFCPSTVPVAMVLFVCKCTATLLFIMVTLKIVLSLVDSRCSVTALSIIATAKSLGSVALHAAAGTVSDSFGLNSVFTLLLVASGIGFILTYGLKLPNGESLFTRKE